MCASVADKVAIQKLHISKQSFSTKSVLVIRWYRWCVPLLTGDMAAYCHWSGMCLIHRVRTGPWNSPKFCKRGPKNYAFLKFLRNPSVMNQWWKCSGLVLNSGFWLKNDILEVACFDQICWNMHHLVVYVGCFRIFTVFVRLHTHAQIDAHPSFSTHCMHSELGSIPCYFSILWYASGAKWGITQTIQAQQ